MGNMADRVIYTDTNCWQGLKQDDPLALGYLYDTYVDKLFITAMFIANDRELVKDALQEVFIELWNYRKSIGDVHNAQAYLTMVLKNILHKKHRTAPHTVSISGNAILSSDENKEEAIIMADIEQEKRSKLRLAVSSLSERQKLILELRFNQGLSYEQIADRLGMNYQSVNNLAFRTFRRLRGAMSPVILLVLNIF
jgi:RNA polymerase sigma-70 factor (ECF subfamily)